jgi:acyl carrier protein
MTAMSGTISSRTPEGSPNHCPICDSVIVIEPSQPPGDAPCPQCGALLWFFHTSAGMRFHESKAIAPTRDFVLRLILEKLGADRVRLSDTSSRFDEFGGDSLDIVELVMAVEGEYDIDISDAEAANINTVGDAIDYLFRHLR